ncbi:MAG TPA: FlgD immunoglobulin-like domain containing protein [Polyangiales bacterium]
MAINGIGGGPESNSVAAPPITVKTGDKQLAKDDFMKLLVAQLKNQDPNNPVDTKEMVTQLSQLTSVEQLQAMSAKLDTLTAATNSSAANSSSTLIGKTVSGVADTVHLDSTGTASGAVKLSQDAAKVTVSVVNAAGRVVRSFDLTKKGAGMQPIEWDGATDSGERAAAGNYTFQVAAKDANGTPIETDMSIQGIVSGVFYENGYPELVVGTSRVPLTNLTSISQ